jgi:hypothetical protein
MSYDGHVGRMEKRMHAKDGQGKSLEIVTYNIKQKEGRKIPNSIFSKWFVYMRIEWNIVFWLLWWRRIFGFVNATELLEPLIP